MQWLQQAAKALKAVRITKLPNLAELQAEYATLQEKKEALYADYGKLKKQVKEYDVIKKNNPVERVPAGHTKMKRACKYKLF